MTIEIANRLIELRRSRGLSQEELAEKLGISRQAVSKWERADSSPDIDNIMALSRLYGISVDELLCNENSTSIDESELVLDKEPVNETPIGTEDGIRNIELSGRANAELVGTDDTVCTVSIDGTDDEKEKVRVFTEGCTLKIVQEDDEGFFSRVFGGRSSVNITVRLPRRMDRIEAELKGGNFKTSEVSAESLEAKLGGGRAAVEGGRIERLELYTGGGSIILRGCSGKMAELKTGGGSIKAEGINIRDRLEAKTGGGSVVISGSSLETEATSGGGDVRLTLAGAERVDAKTGGGSVNVELSEIDGFTAKLFTGGGKARLIRNGDVINCGRTVNAVFGDGRTVVDAKSGGGSVTVSIN